MNTESIVSRRHAIAVLSATIGGCWASPVFSQTPAAQKPALPVTPKPSFPKPTLHVYSDYGWLRGFNYIMPWGARIEDAWWFYDGRKMRGDMALARSVHANAIRLWIDYSVWYRDPEKVTASFLDAIAAIDENGMKAMPCLFNRWVGGRHDYGGTHTENIRPNMPEQLDYVRALVTPLANDPRVFCWDLCNEPQGGADPTFKAFSEELSLREYRWLAAIADTVKKSGARQPVTIGTMNGTNITFYAPLVDVLCSHPYARDRAGLEKLIAGYRVMVAEEQKPMLVNECVPGSEKDEVRGETHRYYLEQLGAAGLGCMPWSIREGVTSPHAATGWMATASTTKGITPHSMPTAPCATATSGCARPPSSARLGKSNNRRNAKCNPHETVLKK